MPQISENTMLAFRDELQKLAAPGGLGAAAGALGRFGQRQLHSLTGWTPKGGLEPLRMASHGSTGPARDALVKAEQMGLTSIPGVAKAVGKHGLLPVLRAGGAAQWHGTSPGMKALMVGLPAAGMAHAAIAQPPPGQSREESIGHEVGNLVGGIAGAPMPIIGSAVLGEGLGQAGKVIGRGVHKARTMLMRPQSSLHPNGSFPRQSTDLTTETGQAAPSETIMTARAGGGAGGGFE
jgi:hypothetical protein